MSENFEIERKFLLKDTSVLRYCFPNPKRMLACYTKWDGEECERIRIESAELKTDCIYTYKKRIDDLTRHEEENEVTLFQAIEAIKLSPNPIMTKTRHYIDYCHDRNLTWEIDIFEGDNTGLMVAEIEIPSSDYDLILPDWVGEEVTHDMRYTNVQLNLHPFNTWK